MNHRVLVLFGGLALLITACSVEKNTLTSKAYHNLASHYNGYFYANEEMVKVEQSYRKAMVDDYNRILRLYPKMDSAQSKTYEKELQEVVKMASIAIQRHKNSKWVDDSYILIGKARLYSLDWGNTIQTFKYVNTTSKNDDARHEAIVNLMRTFTEHKEFNNAQSAAEYLLKSKLNAKNQKQFYLEKAYLAQTQNDLDGMVRNLTLAVPLLKKRSDRPGRIYFIIGQVYQKLGFEAEAYNYYKKCLSTHPEYEVDFYARLYQAQVTEISQSRNIATARKSFKKLLKDSKNKDFKDKIYYEMGVFEYKQKHVEPAVDYFNQSIRVGSNKRVDGEAYLRLGEMYYDTKKYELSQAYYDSAVKSLPPDYENLAAIKKRNEVLDDFVKHLNTIRWQDSLLTMASMDTAALRAHIKASVEANTPKTVAVKKKRANRINIEQAPSSVFSADATAQEEGGTWYFGNASAIALGESEFTRVWGNIVLEDNWRRSQRSATRQGGDTEQVTEATPTQNTETSAVPVDPVAAAFADVIRQLPDTEEKKKESLKKIEDSHFALGDIYSLKLEEPANAIEIYQQLLVRFPKSTYEPEVLYRLYLLTKESDPAASSRYAELLKNTYPESPWAKILINPDYLLEAGKTAQKQKALYAVAYRHYESETYDTAFAVLDQANSLGKTTFTPQLELLRILIIGSTQEPAVFISELETFIEENPENELSAYAKKLLDSSAKFAANADSPGQSILFTPSDSVQHLYALVYTPDAAYEKVITESLESFHKMYLPRSSTFNIVHEKLFAGKHICLVSSFPDRSTAIAYLKLFNEKLTTLKDLKNYNFNNFVITEENLETLKRTQALNEYLTFYIRHYQKENQ